MSHLKKIAAPCLIILLMSCAVQNNDQPKIKQGVFGNVTWLEGNMMPSPDAPQASRGRPVERKLRIYALTTFNEVNGQAPMFSAINTKLVKIIKTTKGGFYECELPTGIYSVFTEEPTLGFFANSFNGKGGISSFEVTPDIRTKLDIVINYKAAY